MRSPVNHRSRRQPHRYAQISAGLLAGALFSSTVAVHAWGPTGHRVVARIAENHLSLQAAEVVRTLLGPDTLIEAATWADEIRSDDRWRHASPWHYVNLADGQDYQRRSYDPQDDPRDILEAIEHFESILADEARSPEDRGIALRWLVHLFGDIHQPLHVGRPEDRGGNALDAVWHGRPTNLHRIWDSEMINQTRLSYSEFAASIDTASPDEIDTWQSSSVLDWLNESLALRQQAYRLPGSRSSDSYRYSYDNLLLLKKRLRQAGVRLAGRLRSILAEEGTQAWQQMPNGLHWMRNSAEYKALVQQIYRSAGSELRRSAEAGELPAPGSWAVALDGDETVLDNSPYQKEQRSRFTLQTWNEWCERAEARAVPGVRGFLELVRALGGRIAIVSNRGVDVQAATERNLHQQGIPFDVVLLRGGDGEKESRWRMIAEGTTPADLPPLEIVMYIGDNVTDFPDLDQSWQKAPDDAFSAFGESYFVLPNPVYGSFTGSPRN